MAVSAVPYSEEVGRSVVDALLHIASVYSLLPHIPVDSWSRLNKRPSLPPVCLGRSTGTLRAIVRQVRTFGDIEIFMSCLLLVWSEWDPVDYLGFADMCTSIREYFSGIGMGGDRGDLVERLDQVLEGLDRGLGFLKKRKPSICGYNIQRAKGQYVRLKGILLEVDREALEILTRESDYVCRTILINLPTCGRTQNPIRR